MNTRPARRGRRGQRRSSTSSLHHQSSVNNVLSGPIDVQARNLSGNPYPSYQAQVAELANKYSGVSNFGSLLAQALVRIRAAFAVPTLSVFGRDPNTHLNTSPARSLNGTGTTTTPTPVLPPDALRLRDTPEAQFLRNLVHRSSLDLSTSNDWAKQAEIEGKALAILVVRPSTTDDLVIEPRFVPWTAKHYEVLTAPDDFATLASVRWEDEFGAHSFPAPLFSYARFSGLLGQPNVTPPVLGSILRHCEDLDRALADWREINRLYASPTPVMQFADITEAKSTAKAFKDKNSKATNWKLGKLLITTANFSLVVPSSPDALRTVRDEIETLMKLIAGVSGVPIHFLGYTDLMSNRATAENLMEYITASTGLERQTWLQFYRDLFTKALLYSNAVFSTTFDPMAFEVVIPETSSGKLAELVNVWAQLEEAGIIRADDVHKRVPGAPPTPPPPKPMPVPSGTGTEPDQRFRTVNPPIPRGQED